MNVFFTIVSFISFVFAFVFINEILKKKDSQNVYYALIAIYFLVIAFENAFLIGW